MARKDYGVTELGYLGIGVSDLAAWRHYATNVLGVDWIDEPGGARLRMDYWHYRIRVHEDPSDDILYAGFRVAGPEELQASINRLEELGIAFERATASEAEQRCVLDYVRVKDPAGLPIEIFHGPLVDTHQPYRPGRGMHGKFRTGALGLGHMIVRNIDVEASYRFYRDLMDLRGNVEMRFGVGERRFELTFMAAEGGRDHMVAFGAGNTPKRIHHLMIEVEEQNDVGLTYDIVRKEKIPILNDIGRHIDDNMFSFYMSTPSGWFCEYGAEGSSPTYQSEYHTVGDYWGHMFATDFVE
ncbi:VOC family protein [Paraburkholderia elongata]|nr:VOC family protein [Paraburkholderia elongata]